MVTMFRQVAAPRLARSGEPVEPQRLTLPPRGAILRCYSLRQAQDRQDRPFNVAQDRPFDVAQDRSFDVTQDRSFDVAQDR